MIRPSGLHEVKKLYVGCSLTQASQEFVDRVERTKLRMSEDWEVLQFLGTTAGTEIDVYQQDIIENVGNCDAFVGVLDEPSFGLGFETSKALEYKKRVMLVAHHASRITRLALALPHFYPDQLEIRRYEDMEEEVPAMVREEFAEVLAA